MAIADVDEAGVAEVAVAGVAAVTEAFGDGDAAVALTAGAGVPVGGALAALDDGVDEAWGVAPALGVGCRLLALDVGSTSAALAWLDGVEAAPLAVGALAAWLDVADPPGAWLAVALPCVVVDWLCEECEEVVAPLCFWAVSPLVDAAACSCVVTLFDDDEEVEEVEVSLVVCVVTPVAAESAE